MGLFKTKGLKHQLVYHQINCLYIGTSFVSMVRLSKVVSTLSKRQSITSFAFFVIFYVLVILFRVGLYR